VTGSFSVKTLGCKLNQYESSMIASALASFGWHAVEFGECADLVIINTCTVTDNADRKCRNYIRQGARQSRSGRVVVTGCLARRDPLEITAMREVAGVVDNTDRGTLAKRLLDAAGFPHNSRASFSEEASLPYGHVRAFLRVQDGCDGECAYCIVPEVRGKPSSRPFDDVMRHARMLAGSGIKEIVLTGITIGRYDCGGRDLADLVSALLDLDGNFRVRITSIEPRHLSAKLVALYANPRLCPHSHLPLQSGSDAVLRRMKRPYTGSEYLDKVSLLRSVREEIAIGTDIIVGFPGETDDEFAETISMVEKAGFAFVHQFAFSPRSGTEAAGVKRCGAAVVRARSDTLRSIARALGERFATGMIGTTVDAVITREQNGLSALTPHYLSLPLVDGLGIVPGDFVAVRITHRDGLIAAVPFLN
jgi:threonylcarbamoyladenosine tRNA methylthiotransferase MtaB